MQKNYSEKLKWFEELEIGWQQMEEQRKEYERRKEGKRERMTKQSQEKERMQQ